MEENKSVKLEYLSSVKKKKKWWKDACGRCWNDGRWKMYPTLFSILKIPLSQGLWKEKRKPLSSAFIVIVLLAGSHDTLEK